MRNSILELKNINKSYMRNTVLEELNMTVNKNDIYGFIGENGAGEITTMRIITSIIKQDSGEVNMIIHLYIFIIYLSVCIEHVLSVK